MDVLIMVFDLFDSMGGGQTVYKRIIETNPDITFHYLIKDENPYVSRPQNAVPIKYQEKYSQESLRTSFYDLEPPPWTYYDFAFVSNIAVSVSNRSFDVVEFPDYYRFGYFISAAFTKHNVTFEKVVLSMHGNLSTSHYHSWYRYHQRRFDCELGEQWQYELADLRYGLSLDYIDEWHQKVQVRAHYLNPLSFLERLKPVQPAPSDSPPNLVFVGRTERRKGPQIFADIVSLLPRNIFDKALLIGPGDGVDSSKIVYEYIKNRNLDIEMLGPKSNYDLTAIFSSKVVTIVPSTYDTFNLVALESLLLGCPTVISSAMGVCRFLRESMPLVPFMPLNIGNHAQNIKLISLLIEHYDEYRSQLVSALEKTTFGDIGPSLRDIYQSPSENIFTNGDMVQRWYDKLFSFHDNAMRGSIISDSVQPLESIYISPHLNTDRLITQQFSNAKYLLQNYQNVSQLPEEVEEDILKKIEYYEDISHTAFFDRTRVWKEIARLESVHGNMIHYVTYALRFMRAFGDDTCGMLPHVCRALEGEGYIYESESALAMYSGTDSERYEATQVLLNERYARFLHYTPGLFSSIDDTRNKVSYKVSVIVSMYNAADKLTKFISLLQNQTLIKQGVVEVIFVETGSPAGDYEVFKRLKPMITFPAVYARTDERETIQSAWNRGISLSRGEYLSFLGVDECIVPTCLEYLSQELDADPDTDWIIGNSVVTDVDAEGNWIKDVMVYDREGYENGKMYLDSCYLSYVGALYRKSIHTRFGYYDPSFRGAGDTEFKCRILPHIKSRSVPLTMGFFLNYPDDRMTNSPRAEVEDLRAWYLHRTLAGVKYAFGNSDVSIIEQMVLKALHYRKSYCKHMSSDVEYAYNLTLLLQEKSPLSPVLKYQAGIKKLLDAYRDLDSLPTLNQFSPSEEFLKCFDIISRVGEEHQAFGIQRKDNLYRLFNDNRYEQHGWVWSRDLKNDDKYEELVRWK